MNQEEIDKLIDFANRSPIRPLEKIKKELEKRELKKKKKQEVLE